MFNTINPLSINTLRLPVQPLHKILPDRLLHFSQSEHITYNSVETSDKGVEVGQQDDVTNRKKIMKDVIRFFNLDPDTQERRKEMNKMIQDVTRYD